MRVLPRRGLILVSPPPDRLVTDPSAGLRRPDHSDQYTTGVGSEQQRGIPDIRDHAEGAARQTEGRLRQTAGGLSGDRKQQAEGLFDEVKGKIVRFKADVEDRIDRTRK